MGDLQQPDERKIVPTLTSAGLLNWLFRRRPEPVVSEEAMEAHMAQIERQHRFITRRLGMFRSLDSASL